MSDGDARNRSFGAILESGCQVNSNGGVYMQSRVISVEKYVVIVNKYEEMCVFDKTKNVPKMCPSTPSLTT